MKTRKYKDNQQRKKFVQNESKIFLTQYFKKIEKVTKDSNLNYGSQELQLLSPSETKLPNATRSGAFSGALKIGVAEPKVFKPQVLKSLEI